MVMVIVIMVMAMAFCKLIPSTPAMTTGMSDRMTKSPLMTPMPPIPICVFLVGKVLTVTPKIINMDMNMDNRRRRCNNVKSSLTRNNVAFFYYK